MDSPNTKRLLSIGEASEHLGVSIDTLRRWEKKGRIIPLRSPGGHRYYTIEDLDALFGKRYTRDEETIRRTDEELGKDGPDAGVSPPSPGYSDKEVVRPEVSADHLSPAQPETLQGVGQQPVSVSPPPDLSNIQNPPDIIPSKVQNIPPVMPEVQLPQVVPPPSPPPPLPNLQPREKEPIETGDSSPLPAKADEDTQKDISHTDQLRQKPASILEPPVKETTAQTSEGVQKSGGFSPPNISLPVSGGDQVLSEEEIEKRIGMIIKKGRKNYKTNTLLAVVLFIVLIIDTFIFYLWFTSARIISPIP